MERDQRRRLFRAYALALTVSLLCVVLAGALVIQTLRVSSREIPLESTLQDPEVRAEVIARLVAENPRLLDSHTDSEVGTILQPDLEAFSIFGAPVSTNRFGLREREYDLPKPTGVVRIVILGDSMVFGPRVAADQRLGSQLERWIRERASAEGVRVEVLHFGVMGWNLQSECAFLRRQLTALAPDLVFHVALTNDLNDVAGVRGFGSLSSFSPQARQYADSPVTLAWPIRGLRFRRVGYLAHGIDYEGDQRYRSALSEIRRLSDAIEAVGGHYRLIFWNRAVPEASWYHIGRHLDPDSVVYLKEDFVADPRYALSERDYHWNVEGHGVMARLFYGLVTRDDLLPQLGLPPWDEASRVATEIIDDRGLDESSALELLSDSRITSSIDFRKLTAQTAAQVHGGIDRTRDVSPYASLILDPDGGGRVQVEGWVFRRPELDGGVEVFADEHAIGAFELRPGTELSLTYPLPPVVSDRTYVSIRFVATDYVYKGSDLRRCVVFRIHRVAIVP